MSKSIQKWYPFFSPVDFYKYHSIASIVSNYGIEKTDSHSQYFQDDPIHIIGMSCRFPGAEGLKSYWDLLVSGKCVIDDSRPYPGGYLENHNAFDNEFFDISKSEATIMDPHQKLALELCWEALHDASFTKTLFQKIQVCSWDSGFKITTLIYKTNLLCTYQREGH